jgi:hypothetical protein
MRAWTAANPDAAALSFARFGSPGGSPGAFAPPSPGAQVLQSPGGSPGVLQSRYVGSLGSTPVSASPLGGSTPGSPLGPAYPPNPHRYDQYSRAHSPPWSPTSAGGFVSGPGGFVSSHHFPSPTRFGPLIQTHYPRASRYSPVAAPPPQTQTQTQTQNAHAAGRALSARASVRDHAVVGGLGVGETFREPHPGSPFSLLKPGVPATTRGETKGHQFAVSISHPTHSTD